MYSRFQYKNNPQGTRSFENGMYADTHFASLEYQSLDGILEAIGLPKDQVCTYCWNGKG